MDKDLESNPENNRLIYEIGRPYFLPFFIALIIALFGELQVIMATVEMPASLTGSLLFSHFGLFLSLSLLTMAGVGWAVRYGLTDNQRRLALATLTVALVLVVFFWPTSAGQVAPVFRIPVTVQDMNSDIMGGLLQGLPALQ
ncbi:MAG: hypothetical protein KDE09_24850 [Anaerolineales bacterium]|nr:hypothetical protein [Anaerolineales bacterium]MCB0021058.1 hypothetical protein [Anaerolineales bacterium]